MSFFETIARSLGAWMEPRPKAASATVACVGASTESALKKYKIDASMYTSVYAPPTAGPSSRKHGSSRVEDSVDDLTARFQRHARVSRPPEWAVGQRVLFRAKAMHAGIVAEYARHLAALDGLDPHQHSGVRARAWQSIAQANIKLAKLEDLVRDLSQLGPRDSEKKFVDRLEKFVEAIAATGREALMLLVRELQVLRAPMSSLRGACVHVFAFLSAVDVARARAVSRAWCGTIGDKRLLSAALRRSAERWVYWASHLPPTRYDYPGLVAAAQHCEHLHSARRSIAADVQRTTFRNGSCTNLAAQDEPAAQAMLGRLLLAWVALDPEIGYCHGMTFLGSALLSCVGYDEERAFTVFAALLRGRGLREVFRLPDLPGALLRMYQLDSLVRLHLPHVAACFLKHKVHPQMYASGWIMALFLHETSVSPLTMTVLLDDFVVHGWPAMFRLYLGLLSVHADAVITPLPSKTLQALVKLPKQLNASLVAALEAGAAFAAATTPAALAALEEHYDPTTSLREYF
ncbi:hypothetical protein ACHHYP_10716 [Achlya hypogyna]|uniref:Rab-GAP TBC domain-containing protein n=1 Tax=Achlya hypogyna TaxID=1202772 RepID=A0A1V9YKP3_ACHHY|nr:hypothetical protein ACHHYP_10716 [Achlya hypogyna]